MKAFPQKSIDAFGQACYNHGNRWKNHRFFKSERVRFERICADAQTCGLRAAGMNRLQGTRIAMRSWTYSFLNLNRDDDR